MNSDLSTGHHHFSFSYISLIPIKGAGKLQLPQSLSPLKFCTFRRPCTVHTCDADETLEALAVAA